MIDRTDWLFINSFAPWFSAVGTLTAVSVSLWLAQRAAGVKLKVTARISRIISAGGSYSNAPQFFQVRTTSHGFRDPTIVGVTWRYYPSFRRTQHFATFIASNAYSSSFPVKLAFGEEAHHMQPLADFEANAGPFVEILRKSWFPRLAVRDFRVGFYTSTGEEFVARIDKNVREVLLRLSTR